jgi:hypothetical protein
MIILDNRMAKAMQRLEPHLGVLDLKKPWAISRPTALAEQTVTTTANWIDSDKHLAG